jgi:hypothetical protein
MKYMYMRCRHAHGFSVLCSSFSLFKIIEIYKFMEHKVGMILILLKWSFVCEIYCIRSFFFFF